MSNRLAGSGAGGGIEAASIAVTAGQVLVTG